MQIATAKLTSKSLASIPVGVRKHLNLKPGDTVEYELCEDGTVQLRKSQPLDRVHAAALSSTLTEWASDADEKAYAGL